MRSFPGQCSKLHIHSQIATCRRLQIVSIVLYYIAFYCIVSVMYLIICCIPQIAPSPIATLPPFPAFLPIALSMHCRNQFATRAFCASCPKSLQAIKGTFFCKKMQRKLLSESDNYKSVFRGNKTRGRGNNFVFSSNRGFIWTKYENGAQVFLF